MTGVIRLLRPKQWFKNVFVLAGVFFSQRAFIGDDLLRAGLAFGLFCVAASGSYALNDIFDAKSDALHPTKKNRPLPSGRVPVQLAWVLAALLQVGALFGSFALSTGFGLVIAGYLLLNLAYTLLLRRIAMLDVFCVSGGFLLRAYGGAVVVGVVFSSWLLLATLFISLLLALGKRREELVTLEEPGGHRASLRGYSVGLLDVLIAVTSGLSVMTYALYAASEEVVQRAGNNLVTLTTLFVLFGLFRYLRAIYVRGRGGAPEEAVLYDPPLVVSVLLWGLSLALLLYL